MVTKLTAPRLPQLPLFSMEESRGNVELFPAVWSAVEDLTLSDPKIRWSALDRLLELNAPRFSPVVAYILVTRLAEPDLALRARIVQALGEVLIPDSDGQPSPDEVRRSLAYYLSQMRTRQIFALLQVAAIDPDYEGHVARLLDPCPFACSHLLDILSDFKAPMPVRQQAANMLGRVGFLDALPSLERLAAKLDARLNGQKSMPFAPPSLAMEQELLPAVRNAISLLKAP
jgi:HEAT repeat protein